jgi:flagellar hook-length control protein FliK
MSSASANSLFSAVPAEWTAPAPIAIRRPTSAEPFYALLEPESDAGPPVECESARDADHESPPDRVREEDEITAPAHDADSADDAIVGDSARKPTGGDEAADDPSEKDELPSEVAAALAGAAAVPAPAAIIDIQQAEIAADDAALAIEPATSAAAATTAASFAATSIAGDDADIAAGHAHESKTAARQLGIDTAAIATEQGSPIAAGPQEPAAEAPSDDATEETGANDRGEPKIHERRGTETPEIPLANAGATDRVDTARVDAPLPAATGPAAGPSNTAAPIITTPATDFARTQLRSETQPQNSAPAHRSPGSEIDAARLLHRVARAFAQATDRQGEVTIRLSPPELGLLRLEVQVRDGALAARLQTETAEARSAILENLSALRDRLAEQGVRIERFDVDLMHQHSGGAPQQSFGDQRQTERTYPAPPATPRAIVQPATVDRPSNTTLAEPGRLNVII